MPFEFVNEISEDGESNVTVDDIQLPGTYKATETGAGITEKYKTERESESGGEDAVDEPPAAELDIRAWVTDETWQALNELRQSRDPFPVSIGPFAFEEMGIVNLSREVDAAQTRSNHVSLRLQQFREVTIQIRSGGAPGSGGGIPGDASGPPSQWVDENGDGIDDRTGEPIPDMQTENIPSGASPTFRAGSGETWGRRLIDLRNGGRPTVVGNGSNWTLQDIGFRGAYQQRTGTSIFGLTSTGGQGLVQNVYIGDGAPSYTGKKGVTGFWVSPRTSSTVIFRYTNTQHLPDNGIYGSAPKGSAPVIIDRCYSANCGHACFRLARGRLERSVGVIDGDFQHRGKRTLWARTPGPTEVNDCDLISNGNVIVAGARDGGGVVNLNNSRVSGGIESNGGTVNGSSSGTPDPNNYSSNIPGDPVTAASGGRSPEGNGGGGVE